MYPSRRSAAHSTIYLIERALALPIAVGVILFADFPRIPNGVMNFLLARVTVLHVLSATLMFAAWVCCFPAFAESRSSALTLGRRLFQNFLGLIVVTAIFGIVLLKARMTTPLEKVLPLFFISVAILTTIRVLLIVAVDSGFWGEKLNVLILGTGPIARRAWREIRTKHHRTANVIGFVDDQCHETALPEIRARHVGTIRSMETTLLKTPIDLIVIALPTKSCYDNIQSAIGIAEAVGVDVIQFESVFSLNRLSQENRAQRHALYSVQRVGQVAAQAFKRILDIVISGAGIILISPLIGLIAIAIKVTDPGPVFFVQERYGYRRRKFRLFKFRTMIVDAEHRMKELEALNEADGPIFKIKNDPRITAIGRVLRKTSLDELPQLWNVLIGHMSLVGPRPMSLRDVALFNHSHLMRRFSVKPGITGLWQVSGRSNTSFDHWISMDFLYIDQWSFWLDLSIPRAYSSGCTQGIGGHVNSGDLYA